MARPADSMKERTLGLQQPHVTTPGWTVKADPAIHSAKLMYFLSDQHGSAPGMTKQISSSFGRPNKVNSPYYTAQSSGL